MNFIIPFFVSSDVFRFVLFVKIVSEHGDHDRGDRKKFADDTGDRRKDDIVTEPRKRNEQTESADHFFVTDKKRDRGNHHGEDRQKT